MELWQALILLCVLAAAGCGVMAVRAIRRDATGGMSENAFLRPDQRFAGDFMAADWSPPTLTEFLLARIAEDEAAARTDLSIGAIHSNNAAEVANEYAARVLAECEAKRRIMEYVDREGDTDTWRALIQVVRELATVYTHHPDYRGEWRP